MIVEAKMIVKRIHLPRFTAKAVGEAIVRQPDAQEPEKDLAAQPARGVT